MTGDSASRGPRRRDVTGRHARATRSRMEVPSLLTAATILVLIALDGAAADFTARAQAARRDVMSSRATSSPPREAAQRFHTEESVNIVESPQGEDICIHPTCVKHAAKVLEMMDRSVDPCDDFYSFACGRFIADTRIPDDRTSVSILSNFKDEVNAKLRSILDTHVKRNDTKSTRLAKVMYKSCLNTSRIEERGLEPMQKILRTVGGWPVVIGSSWNENAFDWKNSTYKLRDSGVSYQLLLSIAVEQNIKNSSYRSIRVDQPQLGLTSEFLLKGMEDNVVKAYGQFQVDIAVVFGAQPKAAAEEMKKVIEFEKELARITVPSEELRDFTKINNEMTLEDMNREFPFVAWIDFLNNILKTERKVDGQYVVTVSVPKYIKELEKLLLRTEKRTLSNYLVWRVIQDFADVLPVAVRNVAFQFNKVCDGTLLEEPRWKQCLGVVTGPGALVPAVGAMYVKEFFEEESVKVVSRIVRNVQLAFKKILRSVDWMDPTTKKRSLEKVDRMRFVVGYPEDLLNDTMLEDYYDGVQLELGQYMENSKKLGVFTDEEEYSKLWKAVDSADWVELSNTADTNAVYILEKNAIVLLAGILQGSIFDRKRPMYMNYGSIGYVIGHEITHGFDDMGRQFDKNGELNDWWEGETASAYLSKTACMVEQYSNYTDKETGLRLNGVITQGENIADNGGAKEAYSAYVDWAGRQADEEPRLPGLQSFNPRQMFWVSIAQSWCSKHRTEDLVEHIMTDVHTVNRYRILGTFRNMEAFASDFNCPRASKMNPVRKCQVW